MTDDGWTTVGRSKGSGSITRAEAPQINSADSSVTVEQLLKEFQKKLRIWQKSSCRATLLSMLEKNKPDDDWKLEKAVCLATGSFATHNFELNRRSMMQFACFVDLVREIGERGGKGVELFAQEPKYATVEKDFLTTLGVTVLHVDRRQPGRADTVPADLGLAGAEKHFSPLTLVCDFFMNMDSQATREFLAAEHGLYIGTPFDQAFVGRDSDLKLKRDRFEEIYVRRKMPRFEEDPGVFDGLMVYWPQAKEEDEDGTGA